VEDNEADRVLFQECINDTCPSVDLFFATDGVEAMRVMRARDPLRCAFQGVLLDLNLPKKDGREILAEMGLDPSLKDLPVIIMSTSGSAEDVAKCQALGARRYLVKPSEFHQYQALVEEIVAFFRGFQSEVPIKNN
jgi:two-component system response regulator